MKTGIARLLQGYAWLMKLYPPRYQGEFGEDRQAVFALAAEEAASRGSGALLRLALKELHDLPASALRANVREWEAMMNTVRNNTEEEPRTWFGLLLGAWPFIFIGPLMAVLPYLPQQTAWEFYVGSPLWQAVAFITLAIGLLVGWRKGFPRWVYPYLVALFFIIVIPLLGQLSLLLGPGRLSPIAGTAILLGGFLLCGAAAFFLLGRIPATRKIVTDVRADWTRLSFGVAVYLAFGAGFYGGDHPAPFSPRVWLPSVAVVLGAIIYLLCRTRLQRVLALLATFVACFGGKLLFPNDDVGSPWPILLLIILLVLPALIELLPKRSH